MPESGGMAALIDDEVDGDDTVEMMTGDAAVRREICSM